MEVPRYNGPKVGQRILPTPEQRPGPTGLGELGRGIEQFGVAAARVQETADMVAAQEAEAEFTNARTFKLYDREKGLLNLRGKNAIERTTPTVSELEETRQQIAKDRLKNDRQRQVFLARTGAHMEDVRRQAENHFVREEDAVQASTLEALQDASLNSLANSYADQTSRTRDMAAPEAPLRLLARRRGLAPEAEEQLVAAWRGKAAQTMISAALAKRDIGNAQALYAEFGSLLGADGARLKATIEGAGNDQVAERTAMSILQASRDAETGWANEDKALAALDELPAGPMKDEVRQRLEHRFRFAEGEKKRAIEEVFNKALATFDQNGQSLGAIDPETKAWLLKNAPDKWHRLVEDADRKARERKTDDAEARRAQAEANRFALLEFMALSLAERAQIDINGRWGATGPNRVGLQDLHVRQREAKEQLEKGMSVNEDSFIEQARARAGVTNKKELKDFDAEMRLAHADWVREHQKPPSREEALKLMDEVLKMKVREGLIFDSEEPEWKRRARERKEGRLPAAPEATTVVSDAPAKRVVITHKDGRRRRVPEAGLDAWLGKNPGWRRE